MSGKIEFSGPFFTKDIKKTIRTNIRHELLDKIASEGENSIRNAMPHKSGATAAGVRGRTKSLGGKQWQLTAVISQTRIFPWKVHRSGSGNEIYRGGRLEAKQHQFRRVGSALRRAIKADLTKGLN